MKRLLLALAILSCGTTIVIALHRSTVSLRQGTDQTTESLGEEIRQLAQMRAQLTSVTERVKALKQNLEAQAGPAFSFGTDSLEEIPMGSAHLTPEQSERLLAKLGFSWAAFGDYLIVSKDTLRSISLEGMRGSKIGSAAAQVLAVTPAERTGIETKTQQLMETYNAWLQSHVQRVEPTGNVVAQYTLPTDPGFSLSLSNNFASGLLETLGTERGSLMVDYAGSWMQDLGMGGTGGENGLKVTRYPTGDQPHYSFELKSSGNTMSTDISPYQPFPAAFLPLFPNGWPDLAKREGFILPKEFQHP